MLGHGPLLRTPVAEAPGRPLWENGRSCRSFIRADPSPRNSDFSDGVGGAEVRLISGPAWAPGMGDVARVSLSLGLKPGSLQMPPQQPRAGSLYPGSPAGPALSVTSTGPLVPSLLPQCQVSWAGRHRTSTVLTRLEMLQVFLAPLPAWRASLIF